MTEFTNLFKVDETESRIFNFFWLGFIIYTFAFILSISELVSYSMCNAMQALGLMFLVPSAILLLRFKFENNYLRVILIIFFIWQLGIILRGFQFDYVFIKQMLFDPYESIFIYLSPLILLFPKNLPYLKKVFTVIIILGIIFLFFDLVSIRQLLVSYDDKDAQGKIEYYAKTLSITAGFILLTFMYHSSRRNFIALAVVGVTLLLSLIRARRSLAVLSLSPLVFAYFIYYSYSKNKTLKIVYFFLISIVVTLIIAYYQYLMSYFSTSSITSWFIDRIGQSTRGGVEQYFYQDLQPLDWVIGKGFNGKYYCPGILEGGPGSLSIFRSGIETDYLNIILKGGLISLGLTLMITVPAILKGLFQSRNMLSKAAAIWILFYLGDLYPTPVTTFTLNYLLVWISVGICYSKSIRDIPEEEVRKFFLEKKKEPIIDDPCLPDQE